MSRYIKQHSGNIKCKNLLVEGDLTIQDDLIFGDVSAGVLGVTGGIDLSGTTSAVGIDLNGGTFSTSAITVGVADKILFRDSGLYINSSADGQLDIVADTTVALSGAVTMDDTAAVASSLTLSGVDALNNIIWTGTNTAVTPAFKFPDDTYIADANGAIGAAAGFILVDIGGTNYKLQTYALA